MRIVDFKCKKCESNFQADADSRYITCNVCHTTYEINNNVNNNNQSNNQMNNRGPLIPPKKKKKNKKKKFLYFFFSLIIIASGVIFYLDYQEKNKTPELFDSLPSEIETKDQDKKEENIESATLKLAPDVDLAAERKKNNNNDIIGRLEIPDLFNVLVVKGTNNEYYLSHSVKRKSDIRGTEFLDYRLTTKSKQLNIYGHNTRDSKIKVAFLKLEKFLKKDFFDKNQYIVFQHDGGKNIYKILAMKEIKQNDNEHMFVDYKGQQFVDHVKKMTTGNGLYNSRDVAYDENSEILVLQTCSHHWTNGFYILTAVRIS